MSSWETARPAKDWDMPAFGTVATGPGFASRSPAPAQKANEGFLKDRADEGKHRPVRIIARAPRSGKLAQEILCIYTALNDGI